MVIFYTVLGRASSAGSFRSASLSCVCESTVQVSALCSVLGSVKPMPNFRWCYCKALPCLSWNAAHLGSSGFASVLKGHHLSAVLVEAAWDSLIRILMTKLDWRQTQAEQSQTGILHIKTAKLYESVCPWKSRTQQGQEPSLMSQLCSVFPVEVGRLVKKTLTFWVSPLPAF